MRVCVPLGVVMLLGWGFTFCDVSDCLVVCLLGAYDLPGLGGCLKTCCVLVLVGWIGLFCDRFCRGACCIVWC